MEDEMGKGIVEYRDERQPMRGKAKLLAWCGSCGRNATDGKGST
jgi:hypothetical protein